MRQAEIWMHHSEHAVSFLAEGERTMRQFCVPPRFRAGFGQMRRIWMSTGTPAFRLVIGAMPNLVTAFKIIRIRIDPDCHDVKQTTSVAAFIQHAGRGQAARTHNYMAQVRTNARDLRRARIERPPGRRPRILAGSRFGYLGSTPSRCRRLRCSLRYRRTASARSRARFSLGFS